MQLKLYKELGFSRFKSVSNPCSRRKTSEGWDFIGPDHSDSLQLPELCLVHVP